MRPQGYPVYSQQTTPASSAAGFCGVNGSTTPPGFSRESDIPCVRPVYRISPQLSGGGRNHVKTMIRAAMGTQTEPGMGTGFDVTEWQEWLLE